MLVKNIPEILKDAGLKVTPQRVAVLKSAMEMDHPTVDQVISSIAGLYPNISQGTVYKTLQTLVDKGIMQKVKTDTGKLRYDAVQGNHHHLYSSDSDRIDDYTDPELDRILNEYFRQKSIPGFEVDRVTVQITGSFSGKK